MLEGRSPNEQKRIADYAYEGLKWKACNGSFAMNGASTITDSLVKEHLLFRGLYNTLKVFDQDCKSGKDLKLQVDKFVADSLAAIDNLDIDALKSLWDLWKSKKLLSWEAAPPAPSHHSSYEKARPKLTLAFNLARDHQENLTLDTISSNSTQTQMPDDSENARLTIVYETDMYRLYLVKCLENKRMDKCNQFFLKCAALTQNNPVWCEWFAFPYHPKPESCLAFRKYYSHEWREIFMISLHNFVRIAVQSSPRSHLVQMIELLSEEAECSSMDRTHGSNFAMMNPFEDELMDDFAVIAHKATAQSEIYYYDYDEFFRMLRSDEDVSVEAFIESILQEFDEWEQKKRQYG